jgi:hypothetical protein
MLHMGLKQLSSVYRRIATRGGPEFELDFGAWEQFARTAASRMPEIDSEEDAAEVAEIVFGMVTTTINGLPKLNFPGFMAVSAHANAALRDLHVTPWAGPAAIAPRGDGVSLAY